MSSWAGLPAGLIDLQTESEPFLSGALEGLRGTPKSISPKYLYDPAGSALFEEICRQPEYYPTRTEIGILESSIGEISRMIGAASQLIELGSGAGIKTEILLDALAADGKIRDYLPFDISREFLLHTAARLRSRYPALQILPVWGDFTADMRDVRLSGSVAPWERVVFMPGSTLGNFDPPQAAAILRSMSVLAGNVLVGIDLQKDPDILESAYNDSAGVTEKFNKNLLVRLARETGAVINPDEFMHEAFYRESMNRIEMHLVARKRVRFRIGEEEFRLAPGESIHTENSYKYSQAGFRALCHRAGFAVSRSWTDPREWFAVCLLTAQLADQCSGIIGDDPVHAQVQ